MPPNIEVLVANYNTADLLISGIIEPLRSHWGSALSLTIVDDASRQDDLHQLKDSTTPISQVAVHADRRGPAATFNHLLSIARAPLVFLCNSDVVIPRLQTLLHLQAALNRCGPKAIIGTAEGPRYLDSEARPYTLRPARDRRDPVPQDYVSACAMMLRRQELPKTATFPLHYTGGYYEDTHFCYDLRSEGWCMFYVHSSVGHIGNQAMIRQQLEARDDPERLNFLATIDTNRQTFLKSWADVLRPQTNIIEDAIHNTLTVNRLLTQRETQCQTPS